MRLERPGGVALHHELVGDGEPMVLVHGSWADRTGWRPAVDAGLAAAFRVFLYDRRGHGQSGTAPAPGTRRQDEDDLAAVLEHAVGAPAHVVGNSFGGSLTLGLAARRPGLFRSISVHEPPLVSVVADDPASGERLAPTVTGIETVLGLIRDGEHAEAARRFVDDVAQGPGSWARLPEEERRTVIAHADTFLDEQSDSEWAAIDLDALARCPVPVLLTHGTDSPPWFVTILDRLAEVLPDVRRVGARGAGHVPHATHPQEYAAAVTSFARRH